jgi:hypothetical protein
MEAGGMTEAELANEARRVREGETLNRNAKAFKEWQRIVSQQDRRLAELLDVFLCPSLDMPHTTRVEMYRRWLDTAIQSELARIEQRFNAL